MIGSRRKALDRSYVVADPVPGATEEESRKSGWEYNQSWTVVKRWS